MLLLDIYRSRFKTSVIAGSRLLEIAKLTALNLKNSG